MVILNIRVIIGYIMIITPWVFILYGCYIYSQNKKDKTSKVLFVSKLISAIMCLLIFFQRTGDSALVFFVRELRIFFSYTAGIAEIIFAVALFCILRNKNKS